MQEKKQNKKINKEFILNLNYKESIRIIFYKLEKVVINMVLFNNLEQ